MALQHYLWSRVAAANASADPAVNFSEGQAPSSVNDSARALMASAAGFRDDIAGAIVTGGGSTAYTVSSYQVFNSLANMSGQVIAFTPHATNGATVTINVGVELLAGMLIAGTPYVATYNNSDAVWYLHGFYGNPYNIPLGGGMIYTGSTAPNSSFVFPYGQAISRSTYATYFSLVGTTYGVGDGSTTFNVLDLRGRLPAGKDDMGGSAASRITTAGGAVDGGTLGAVGGQQNRTLLTANLPAYTPAGTIVSTISDAGNVFYGFNAPGSNVGYGGTSTGGDRVSAISELTVSSAFTGTAQGGTSTAVQTLPPIAVLNYILRII